MTIHTAVLNHIVNSFSTQSPDVRTPFLYLTVLVRLHTLPCYDLGASKGNMINTK